MRLGSLLSPCRSYGKDKNFLPLTRFRNPDRQSRSLITALRHSDSYFKFTFCIKEDKKWNTETNPNLRRFQFLPKHLFSFPTVFTKCSKFFHIWKDMRLSEASVLTLTLTCWWRCTNGHTSLFIACTCSMTSLVTVRPCPIVVEILLSSPSILSYAIGKNVMKQHLDVHVKNFFVTSLSPTALLQNSLYLQLQLKHRTTRS